MASLVAEEVEDATCSSPRRSFVRLLRAGVQQKVQQEATSSGGGAWRTLAWRDAFSTEPLFEATVDGAPLRVRQQLQGELQGFGTGLTVWPAACVLLKYLDHRFGGDAHALQGQYALELGSGTGAVAIAAAMLGARRVVVTDMDNVRFLMQANVDLAVAQARALGRAAMDIQVATYEWGAEPSDAIVSSAGEFPDVILVSDCILPRLYPIEPLVAALDLLAKPHTTVLISFEHRYYEPFDPKTRFWDLMRAKNFTLRALDADEYHPLYRADDIEIWEITRR